MNRSVIVDDNDVSSIVYNGPWVASDLALVSPAPSYSNTIHMITTTGSFDYSFTGSEIIVVGYMLNTTQEAWSCAIDEITIPNAATGSLSLIPLPFPNIVLCSWDLLTDSGPHTLTVNVNNADQNHPFYFNYIEYLPTQSAAFDNATVLVNPADNEIKYGGQWSQLSFGMGTSGPNSNFTFTFEGISLALLGHHLRVAPNATIGNATYLVDNKSPVSFDLTSSTPVILFETLQLPFGTHELTMVYQNDNLNRTTFALFVLDALIVQNATTPPNLSSATYPNPTTSIPTVTATETLISSPELISTSGPSRQKLTPIAGGIIGGLVIFLVLVLLTSFILLRRRGKNEKPKLPALLPNSSRKSEIAPYTEQAEPVYRPPSPSSESASSSSCLSYTSRSEYHHTQQAPTNGYRDAISLDRQTRGNSMANSPWDGIAENGLLQRPDDLGSPDDSDAKAGRIGLPSNPAVYLEAHKRALRQLLGDGPSMGSPDTLRSVTDSAIHEDVGQNHQSGVPLKPSMFEGLNKEEGRLN